MSEQGKLWFGHKQLAAILHKEGKGSSGSFRRDVGTDGHHIVRSEADGKQNVCVIAVEAYMGSRLGVKREGDASLGCR